MATSPTPAPKASANASASANANAQAHAQVHVQPPAWRGLLLCAVLLLLMLSGMFSRSFDSSQILFSSDGPLGANSATYAAVPAGFDGMWQDIYWVGGYVGTAFVTLTYMILWGLKPLYFAKFYAGLSLFALGLGVWVMFRQLRLHPAACILGALAAALNTNMFSYACWGLGTVPLATAALFLALAALVTPSNVHPLLKAALGGAGIGMSVMEGFDVGAIYSLAFSAFAVHQSIVGRARDWKAWATGVGKVAIAGGMAGFVAAQAVSVLVATQVQGVVGMQQDTKTKQERWVEATRWSLPKTEALRIVIPGVFGYRMDTPNGGQYWGGVGAPDGQPQARHSGSGVYGGLLVAVIAFWAFLQSLAGKQSALEERERHLAWFWAGTMAVALILACGRHTPLYKLVYALPYFSTIRLPVKYIHTFEVGLVILFGLGVHGMARRYLSGASAAAKSVKEGLQAWWASVKGFDRKWTVGLGTSLIAAVVGWFMLAASRGELESYLKKNLPETPQNPGAASAIAGFCLGEIGWFVLFLGLVALVLTVVASGAFRGKRARWAFVILGAIMLADFARANAPWVQYWNYKEKYVSNPVLDLLRARPYEQRVVIFPGAVNEQLGFLHQYYGGEWLQHQFPFFDIQTLDVAQEPRVASENAAYRKAFYSKGMPGYLRMLQLTSSRYVMGLAGDFANALNQQADPEQKRFRLAQPFTFTQPDPKGPIVVTTNAQGPFGLLEFGKTLPKAKLFARWQVETNDEAVLGTLSDAAFDPHRQVLVSTPIAVASTNAPSDGNGGVVEFVSYKPQHIVLRASAAAPSVLLLNDKHNENWAAFVDGQPQPLLRCNYLMRGVQVPAGAHQVEFRFALPSKYLHASVSGIFLALLLTGFVWWRSGKPSAEPTKSPSQ